MKYAIKLSQSAVLLILVLSCNQNSQESRIEQNIEEKTINSFLDRVGNDDTLYIQYYTEGCFHRFHEEMKIFQTSDSLFAALTTFVPYGQKEIGPFIKPLTANSKDLYDKLEKNGKDLKTENSCTSTASYVIKFKKENIKFADSSCQFEDYHDLKRELYTEEELLRIFKEINR